jgi:hypothetical protein
LVVIVPIEPLLTVVVGAGTAAAGSDPKPGDALVCPRNTWLSTPAVTVEGAALAPPPIMGPYCANRADADSLAVVSNHGIAPATPAVFATFIEYVSESVVPSATVIVALVAGAVIVTLLMLVELDKAAGSSAAAIAPKVPTPVVAEACNTWLVVVSEAVSMTIVPV